MIKYIIAILFLAAFGSIAYGYLVTTAYSQKFIGFGVAGLFLVAIPLFSYYRWKDKKMEDYIINNENLKKMRENEKRR
ncbi:hypothetical protein KH5_10590 [Urechidicola sp. KH5]